MASLANPSWAAAAKSVAKISARPSAPPPAMKTSNHPFFASPPPCVRPPARGESFNAANARSVGMVGELGGMEDAIQYAAGKADFKAGEYDVRTIPAPRTLADFFGGGGGGDDGSEAAANFLKPKIEISPDS